MRFGIHGRLYEISREDILNATRGVRPKWHGQNRYYVELQGVKFPLKQPIHLVTGLPHTGFTKQYAEHILTKLGFTVQPINGVKPMNRVIGTNSVDGTIKLAVTLRAGEDGYIVASVPALPGCYSQGRTEDEAIANIREAIRGYIASMRKHGEEIPSITEVREVEVPV